MSRGMGRFCGYCGRRCRAVPNNPDFAAHAFFTFMTCGLWFLPFLLIVLNPSYTCSRCGSKV